MAVTTTIHLYLRGLRNYFTYLVATASFQLHFLISTFPSPPPLSRPITPALRTAIGISLFHPTLEYCPSHSATPPPRSTLPSFFPPPAALFSALTDQPERSVISLNRFRDQKPPSPLSPAPQNLEFVSFFFHELEQAQQHALFCLLLWGKSLPPTFISVLLCCRLLFKRHLSQARVPQAVLGRALHLLFFFSLLQISSSVMRAYVGCLGRSKGSVHVGATSVFVERASAFFPRCPPPSFK